MKKKSFIVSVAAALFALLLLAGCDCCHKKHHKKHGDQTCQSCQCQTCNGNNNADGGIVVTEEDALLEVVPDTPPANPPAK